MSDFHFQPSHELEDLQLISSYLLSPPPPVNNNNVQTNLFATDHSSQPPAAATCCSGKKRRKPPTNNDDEKNVKKISHREIEKQRRQEMAKLYASLRSLLPLEYIKGKRSISHHMDEAVNYINNLQQNISQLRSKKEIAFTKNPTFSSSSSGNNASTESCTNRPAINLGSTVTIKVCGNGMEILIRINRKDEVFPISRMMSKMVCEGLNLTSYLSSKTHDDATLYSFISEVDDPSCCIDIIRLQKTLMAMIMQESTSQ